MSTDARRIYNLLRQRGLEYEPYEIELSLAKFYPNHIISVIEQVMPCDQEALERAKTKGYSYFSRPIDQILSKRTQAHRTERIGPTEHSKWVYLCVRSNLLLADFSSAELQILLAEIPTLIRGEVENLNRAIGACKSGNVRNIFYLRSVLAREHSTIEGRTREATQANEAAEARAWSPPEGYESPDSSERAVLRLEWEEKLREIELNKAFDNIAKTE